MKEKIAVMLQFKWHEKPIRLIVWREEYTNGGTALLICEDDEVYTPYTDGSKWIVGLLPDEIAIKNYSENEGLLEQLIEQKIVTHPHRFIGSRFVNMPICKLGSAWKEEG